MSAILRLNYKIFLLFFAGLMLTTSLFAGSSDDPHAADAGYDPAAPAFHHISDANVYSIGPWQIPLPCIIYVPGEGWHTFSSSQFHITTPHGDGLYAVDRFVLIGGRVKRIKDSNFPMGKVELGKDHHEMHHLWHGENPAIAHNGKTYNLAFDNSSTADGGVFGGGITPFYDFSLTKNVVSMILVCFFMGWFFISMARKYARTQGQAPSGAQSLFETIIVFIQDEVAKPFLGKDWERLLPFLLTLFFFILGLNLWGQVPFFGGANVTGNLAVTMVLAFVTFLVTLINGNKHYWEHMLWMPGVPAVLKILILTPVEVLGMFIKPITLALRLFANITAGHMVMVIFVALIFLFGNVGANPAAAWGTGVGSTLLTLFMMAIELLVAFIQAFVFTILTASYLGAATEEAHHDHEGAH